MFYKVSVSLVVVVCTAVQWCHQLRVGHETPVLWVPPASLTLTPQLSPSEAGEA